MSGVEGAVSQWAARGGPPRCVAIRPRRWDDAAPATDRIVEAWSDAVVTTIDAIVPPPDRLRTPVIVICPWDTTDDVVRSLAPVIGREGSDDIVIVEPEPLGGSEAAARAPDWVGQESIDGALARSAGRRHLFDLLIGASDPGAVPLDWAAEVIETVNASGASWLADSLAVAPRCPLSVLAGVGNAADSAAALASLSLDAVGLVDVDRLIPAATEVLVDRLGPVRRGLLAERIETALAERDIDDDAAADALCALGPLSRAGRALLVRCVERVDGTASGMTWARSAWEAGDRSDPVVGALASGQLRRGDPESVLRITQAMTIAGRSTAEATWLTAVASCRLGRWTQAIEAASEAANAGHTIAATWLPALRLAGGSATERAGDTSSSDSSPVALALGHFVSIVDRSIAGDDAVRGVGAAEATMLTVPEASWPFDPIAALAATADVIGTESAGGLVESSSPERRAIDSLLALRAGRWRDAAVIAGSGSNTVGRLGLVTAAVRVGLARRSGDLVALTQAWENERWVVGTCESDLFVTDAVGELTAAAARLGRQAEVHQLAESMNELSRGLAPSSPWLARLHWHRFVASVVGLDLHSANLWARRLGDSVVGTRRAPLAAVAAAWTEVLTGQLPVDARRLASDLAAIGLPWEASRFAGAAAAVASEVSESRRLLELARNLRPGLGARSGESPLSEREREIGALVGAGSTYKEIGAQLYISPKTVEHHVARIRTKLGATTRAEMLAALQELG
jgi:DNA-binding CsgD family transcriptional regulator